MNRLIAFTGLAGAGKSTAAEHIKQTLYYRRLSFAHPIRMMLQAVGINQDQLIMRKNEPIDWLGGKTARQLMQTLGTEWGRAHVHADLWVILLRRQIEATLESGCPGVVIDDCRFDNEARMIHELGGLVVRVSRADLATRMDHPSELGVCEGLTDLAVRNEMNGCREFGAYALACIRGHIAGSYRTA